jgi:hypothetical protein
MWNICYDNGSLQDMWNICYDNGGLHAMWNIWREATSFLHQV